MDERYGPPMPHRPSPFSQEPQQRSKPLARISHIYPATTTTLSRTSTALSHKRWAPVAFISDTCRAVSAIFSILPVVHCGTTSGTPPPPSSALQLDTLLPRLTNPPVTFSVSSIDPLRGVPYFFPFPWTRTRLGIRWPALSKAHCPSPPRFCRFPISPTSEVFLVHHGLVLGDTDHSGLLLDCDWGKSSLASLPPVCTRLPPPAL